MPSTPTSKADLIRLIIRDGAVHGYYIGYKFQKGYEQATPERQQELRDYTFSLMYELYENEVLCSQELYDGVGLTEDVKKFLHYNANKALMNLGFEPMFLKDDERCELASFSWRWHQMPTKTTTSSRAADQATSSARPSPLRMTTETSNPSKC